MERLIIGISGASGVQYGTRALELLKPLPVETHLVMSKSAELTVHHELECSVESIRELADQWHPVRNVGAAVASGSFRNNGHVDRTLLDTNIRRNHFWGDLVAANASS